MNVCVRARLCSYDALQKLEGGGEEAYSPSRDSWGRTSARSEGSSPCQDVAAAEADGQTPTVCPVAQTKHCVPNYHVP